MIRVNAYPNSEATAASVADAVKARIAQLRPAPDYFLDPANPQIAILLQNFGNPGGSAIDEDPNPNDNPNSLFVYEDNVNVDTDNDPDHNANWSEPGSAPNDRRAWRSPWMTHGIAHAQGWMNDFLNHYESDLANPTVDRFHFDFEYSITQIGSANFTFLLYAMTKDWRWAGSGNGQVDIRVPGFDLADGTPRSMQNLWDARPNWTNPIDYRNTLWAHSLLENAFSTTSGAHGVDWSKSFSNKVRADTDDIYNRDLFLWYDSIANRARTAALNEAAYTTIKQHNLFAQCKTTNYGDTKINALAGPSRKNDDFGWHEEAGYTGTTPTFSRNGERGVIDTRYYGHHPCPISNGSFFVSHDRVTDADFSAPNLYAVGLDGNDGHTGQCGVADGQSDAWTRFVQRKPYLAGSPEETRFEVSQRYNRRWLESIINSYAEDGPWSTEADAPWSKLCPWVPLTDSRSLFSPAQSSAAPPPPDGDPLSSDDSNRLLSLVKSKRLPEMIVWGSTTTDTGNGDATNGYPAFEKVYRQVYDPTLTSFDKLYASNVMTTPAGELERLTDTNRRYWIRPADPLPTPQLYNDYWTEITQQIDNVNTSKTGMSVTFENVRGPCAGASIPSDETLRLFLECEVKIGGIDIDVFASLPLPFPTVYGYIQIKKPSNNKWYYVLCGDNPSDTARYEFFAPENVPVTVNHTLTWTSRREFTLCLSNANQWVSSTGRCEVRLRSYPRTSLSSRSEQLRWRNPWKSLADFSQRMHRRR